MKKSLVITIALFLFSISLFSQSISKEIGFFAPIYNTKDETTAKLIVDLYFNHLLTNNTIQLFDFRTRAFSENLEFEDLGINIALSIEVFDSEKKWTIIFHALTETKKSSKEKTYDSYYQVLLEAKNELNSFIESLEISSDVLAKDSNTKTDANHVTMTLDSIAGTWFTDTSIDKIIILRGGRGFVIFKNGASMNISVQIKGSQIIALQTSKTNASFLPELPRELALRVAAEGLAPLEWIMSAQTENEMVGEKKHYEAIYENNIATGVKTISSPSKWTR